MCRALTEALDRAVAPLIDSARDRFAIVALGGYGRGELSPFSDVDLMLLHDVHDASELAAGLFRPLWDAKLRVGHSVRTVKEAAGAARERFETQTTLLTGRLVSGSRPLFEGLLEQVSLVTRARPLRRHLVAAERERREQAPFLLMASDVKSGRGGLRTLQGFEWERRREDIIGRFSTDSLPEEHGARESLLRVRNALHVTVGRAHDVFSPELREAVARWLEMDVFETAAELVEAMITVDALATRRWPEVRQVMPTPLARRLRTRLSRRPKPPGDAAPSLERFIRLLETGEEGRLAFERLWDGGHLDDVLPEWEMVRALPQLEPFHEHPVSTHLWRTVAEIRSLAAAEGHFGRIAGELARPDVLSLSAFLHDIGKGLGGDHAVVGAEVARRFCIRLEAPDDLARLVVDAVRHHLLLPRAATRRDLDDPSVIDDVARTVGSLELLQLLYLLTVADSKATGATMWNEWKAVLLRTLFTRCAARFGADRRVGIVGTTREEVLAVVGSAASSAAISHLEAMPDDYLRSATAGDVVWHLDLLSHLEGESQLGVRADQPHETAVVIGRSRPDLRRLVAEVFAAHGVDVLEARLLTRRDGIVIDTFRVKDDRTGDVVDAERWDPVRGDIEAGLQGELDTESKVATRAAAYPVPATNLEKPSARAAIDPASGDLVLTVKCSDRIGRLAEILSVLTDVGLEIRLAQLDSRQGEVVDTFHVTPDASMDAAAMETVGHRIADALSP